MSNDVCSSEMMEIISEMNAKLNGIDDDFVGVLHIEGDCSVTLDMSAKGDKLTVGAVDNSEVEVSTSLKTLQKMLSGKLNPMVAYSTRKLKLKGDMAKAIKLAGVLGK